MALMLAGLVTAAGHAVPSRENNMVVEYIRYEVPSSRHAEFLAAYKAAAQELQASAHCLGFEISEGVEEPDHFIVRIEWDSVDGHEQGFRNSSGFKSFFDKVKPFFSDIREMKHYRVATVGKGAGAR
jgi:quinol monooxygenase YgiN